jgi:DNA polymerase
VITIDFETRSACDLKACGAYRYSIDETTSVLCLAYTDGFWKPGDNDPVDLLSHVRNGGLIEAHNAEFEYVIWNNICAVRFGWPRLNLEQLRCSAAKAAALGLPRKLSELGKMLELDVQKGDSRLMLRMSKPRRHTKNDLSDWHEKPEDLQKLYDYCKQDVAAEMALPLRCLIDAEQKTWELTAKINERGIYCDTELCTKAIVLAQRYNEELTAELGNITEGRITSPGQVARFLKEVPIPDMQADTIDEWLKSDKLNPYQKRLLEIRRALSRSSISKYQAMVNMACPDNRIRGTLLYHGAHTGRWSGRGIQPQNLIKGKVDGDLFENIEKCDYRAFKAKHPDLFTTLAAGVRGMLRATPGSYLLAGDFNAIEARVVCWLAGDENLNTYVRGGDPYIEMAARVFNIPDSQITKEQRQLGKVIVLACGFGMGSEKFQATCETYGIQIDRQFADYAVQTYRSKYHAVRTFWYQVQDCATQTIAFGETTRCRGVTFYLQDKYLFCKLPSGRSLAYYNPRLDPDITYRDDIRTYGGKLVENITQAVARDVLRDALFRLESAGFPVIMTVHDEVVCEGGGEEGHFKELMEVVPPWAEGLPIKVETWRDERYKK